MFPFNNYYGCGRGGQRQGGNHNFRSRGRSRGRPASRGYYRSRRARIQQNVQNNIQLTPATHNAKESIAISALKSIGELLCCGICMERLSHTMISCINGHIICVTCRRRLSNHCPTCKGQLISNRPTVLCNIMDALPVLCRNEDCDEMTSSKEMIVHESSCEVREITCKICNVSFRAKHLRSHAPIHTLSFVKGNFIKHSIQIDGNARAGGDTSGSSRKQDPTATREVGLVNRITRIWFVHGQHFWVDETTNEVSNSYVIEISWVPVGKHDAKEFVATVVIDPDSRDSLCEATQKLTRSNDVVFSFSLQLLKSFIESGGYVKHQLSLKKVV